MVSLNHKRYLEESNKITKAVKKDVPILSIIITKQQEGSKVDMEKFLATWVDQNR